MARIKRILSCVALALKNAYSLSGYCLAIVVVFASSAFAEIPEDSLAIYAVNIHRTPTQNWPGYGIYLANGLFITAAHVVGRSWLTRPKVVIANQEYPTRVVKEGSLEETDLTLLAVEESLLPLRLRMRRNPLCDKAPWAGENVLTVVPQGIARSQILAPERLPPSVRKFSTVIADLAKTGNSGSGVFDAERKCLLGIISRKISQSRQSAIGGKAETRDIAKYFVPASTIADFIPAELRY